MIKEIVELNGYAGFPTCPECGMLVKPCDKCSLMFHPGETVYCVEDEYFNQSHYHEDCLPDPTIKEDDEDI